MTWALPLFVLSICWGLSACDRSQDRQGKEPQPAPAPSTPTSAAPAPGPKPAEEARAPAPSEKPEPAPPKKRYVVAALGDSITDARVGGGGYLDVLRKSCPESAFLNFGRGGDMTNQMRRRYQRDIVPQIGPKNIDTLLVYGGVNDLYSDLTAGRTNDRIEKDLSAIYSDAKRRGLQVVAVTVSPWGGFSKYFNERRGNNTKLLNSWILGQVATGLVDDAVDSFAVLSCGDENVLCPEFETRFHDGLHPGEKGHEILGKKLSDEAFADCL